MGSRKHWNVSESPWGQATVTRAWAQVTFSNSHQQVVDIKIFALHNSEHFGKPSIANQKVQPNPLGQDFWINHVQKER